MARGLFTSYRSKRTGRTQRVLTGLTWSGVRELRAALVAAGAQAPQLAARALTEEMETTMTLSKEQVPVDTGLLRSSGRVTITVTSGGAKGTWSYGTEYALPVHELLDVYHRVGNAKFLEKPVMERASGMEQRLAAAIRAEIV